jgi:hypothetical protein
MVLAPIGFARLLAERVAGLSPKRVDEQKKYWDLKFFNTETLTESDSTGVSVAPWKAAVKSARQVGESAPASAETCPSFGDAFVELEAQPERAAPSAEPSVTDPSKSAL